MTCTACTGSAGPASPTGPVAVVVPSAAPSATDRCAALLEALPASLGTSEGDLARRTVTGERAAAWGDPAVVLECGVPDAPLVGETFAYGPPDGSPLTFVVKDTGAARTFTTGELAVDVRITLPDAHEGSFLADLVPVLQARLG